MAAMAILLTDLRPVTVLLFGVAVAPRWVRR